VMVCVSGKSFGQACSDDLANLVGIRRPVSGRGSRQRKCYWLPTIARSGGWNCIRRTDCWRNAERNHHWSQADLIPVFQPASSGHALVADVSTILAPEILEHCLMPFEHKARVVS
jgi:hypothetical protein